MRPRVRAGELVEEVADRVGIIRRGELIFIGTKDELQGSRDKSGWLEKVFLELTEEESEVQD